MKTIRLSQNVPSNLTLILAASLSALVAGCGNVSVDLGNLNTPSVGAVQLSQGVEFIAASQVGQQSLNGYGVDSATGSSFGQLKTTTANGFTVYSSMQGRLISEDQELAAARGLSSQ